MNDFKMGEKISADQTFRDLWEQVYQFEKDISNESRAKKINQHFQKFIDLCKVNLKVDTSEIICQFEDILREDKIDAFLVARKAHAPLFCAKTHSGRECAYYLHIVDSEKKRNVLFEQELCADAAENRKRLQDCGLRVVDAAAEDAENRRKNPHLYLPDDLSSKPFEVAAGEIVEPHCFIAPETVLFYNSSFRLELLETYAKETKENKLSKALTGTGIVPMRTLAPISLWPKISALLKKQASERQAFMQTHVSDAIYEQLIPLGFQVFGTIEKSNYLLQEASAYKKQPKQVVPPAAALSEKHVVYEIYAAPFRRFHIDVSAVEYATISACKNETEMRTHLAMLAKRINVEESEFSLIKNWSQLDRNIFLNTVN